jgi:hypothetical protein
MQSIRALFNSGARKFFSDAAAWGASRRSALMIALLPIALISIIVLIAVLSLVMHTPFRAIFRWITAEDSILEWGQFLFVFVSSMIFLRIGLRLVRTGQPLVGCFYMLLSLASLFVAGEEISWGQRVFGWGTPEELDAINHQGETNVHNIRTVQQLFGFVVMFGGMYGAFAPLAFAKLWGNRPRGSLSFLAVPPLFLSTAFLMPFSYRLFRLVVWPDTDYTVVKFGEAPELCLYFGLVLFAYFNLRRLQVAQPDALADALPTT